MAGVRYATASDDADANALLSGFQWDALTLHFSFPVSASDYEVGYPNGEPLNNFEALNAVQGDAVRTIFASLSSFTSLSFAELNGALAPTAELRFAMTDASPTAHAYYPHTHPAGGDSWFNNSRALYDNPVAGNYAWFTFMHEIGHALGLSHGHDSLSPERDSIEFSVMTYRSYVGQTLGGGYGTEPSSFAQSYMMYDIAALQHMYGANFGFRAGDTSYRWDPSTGALILDGIAEAAPTANRTFLTVWDGGGEDTYDLSLYATGVSVDLRPGQWSTASAVQLANLGSGHIARGNIANALLYQGDTRSLIENAVGGSGADTLLGNEAANKLWGGGGADRLEGFSGDDQLFGGPGDDLYIVEDAGDAAVEFAGEGDADEVRTALPLYVLPDHIEILTGTSSASQDLRGNGGDNRISGGPAGDLFRLEDGGADRAIGGGGNDGFYFGGALAADDRIEGGEGGDQLALQGEYSGSPTVLSGSRITGVETLVVLSGSDARFGDGAGASYSYRLQVQDDLLAAGALLTVTATDLRALESLDFDGSAETDGRFIFYAGLGDDRLIGGGGGDAFFFGNGGRFSASDRIDGGAGADQIGLRGDYSTGVVLAADSFVNVESIALLSASDTRFAAGGALFGYRLVAHDGNVAAGASLTVTASSLQAGEWLDFDGSAETDGAFRLIGGKGDDLLTGGAGEDLLYGGLGEDRLTGGPGDEVFLYRAAAESSGGSVDRIVDFAAGDRIDLSFIDADRGAAGNQAFQFVGDAAFSAAGQLRAHAGSDGLWTVEADLDGDGLADFMLSVTVADGHPLTAADFVL